MLVNAAYLRFSRELDLQANAALHAVARGLLARRHGAIRDVMPAFGTIYVAWDGRQADRDEIVRHLRTAQPVEADSGPREVVVPVRLDGADLADLRQRTGVDVGARLLQSPLPVLALGATPGQPFFGPIDPALERPRRPTPRRAVPAGALGIASRQATIYPVETPGGWNLVGTAVEHVYDPHRAEPFAVAPGDRIRLVAADGPAPAGPQPLELLPAEPERPVLRVDEPGPLDLVVDAGRPGAAHLGMAESGALDGPAARLANALAGNGRDAALVEATLLGPRLTALASCVVASAGALALELNGDLVDHRTVLVGPGDRLRLVPTGAGVRGYLAVGGGVASARFLGSASVDRRGLIGRPLRAGDVLGAAGVAVPRTRLAARPAPRPDGPLRLLPGPQATPEALAALVAGEFAVEAGDRMGIRLAGSPVPGGELQSESPPLGAVQVTPDGQPIVLLNDRLRLAGYAKPAVIHPADLARCAQLRPGERVRFALAEGGGADGWYVDV